MPKSIDDVLLAVQQADVHFIRLQFVDIFGRLKNVAITTNRLEKVLNEGLLFDGSAIDGHMRQRERELLLVPEVDTFCMLPWRPQQGSVSRLMCSVMTPDNEPFEGDSRHILRKQVEGLARQGMGLDISTEIEFFLLRLDDDGNPVHRPHDRGGYFDVAPADKGENTRRDISFNLEGMGFEVIKSQHGISPGQHMVSFAHGDALSVADNITTFRLVVRTIARSHGLHATFMPQPTVGINGSGLHMLMSIASKGGGDMFRGGNDYGLSDTAMHFMGGLLEHAPALCFLLNPVVNSYRRLVPGNYAPTKAAWSHQDSNLMLRSYSRRDTTRLELRSPDPSCNPYLGISAIIAAGMDGMERKLSPGDPLIDESLPAPLLPTSLYDAMRAFEADAAIRQLFDGYITGLLLEAKQRECDDERTRVSSREVDAFLAFE